MGISSPYEGKRCIQISVNSHTKLYIYINVSKHLMGRKMMVFAAVATAVMLPTVFSSAVLKSSSSLTDTDTYNTQVQVSAPILMRHNARVRSGSGGFNILNSNPAEKNWLANAYGYAYEKYGVNASSNGLDFLQYESMIGFFKWYSENFEQLPVERRN